jgi:hypothetical protein
MATAKPPARPAILSANALLGGEVVYFGAAGWTVRLDEALVAADADVLARLEAVLADPGTERDVVDPAFVAVTLDDAGRIVPDHYRERIRALGPTVRADLGPQAEGKHRHVSL